MKIISGKRNVLVLLTYGESTYVSANDFIFVKSTKEIYAPLSTRTFQESNGLENPVLFRRSIDNGKMQYSTDHLGDIESLTLLTLVNSAELATFGSCIKVEFPSEIEILRFGEIEDLTLQMNEFAAKQDFIKAAKLRDEIEELKNKRRS